jgi:hypothetical protein
MKPILTVSTVLLAALTALGTSAPSSAQNTGVQRKVYFAAVDPKGAFVTDLTAADLAVKENGKDRAIDEVKPAVVPIQLSILVDDAGTGGLQGALGQFFQTMFGRAEFALRILNPQAIKVMDFTRDGDELRTALGRLGQRGRIPNDGEQIIAGVSDAAKELKQRKAGRPSILALTLTGEKPLSDLSDEALKALRDSGASLNVVYLTGVDLGIVLGDGPKQSGGIIERVNGHLMLGPSITKIADTLLNQYVLTYTIPDGVKLSDRFSLTTSRKGVKLLAPTRIPDK